MAEIIYREESYRIIGACFEVYKAKGCGFTEPIYQECLELEFQLQGIPYVSQATMEMNYKRHETQTVFQGRFRVFRLHRCRTKVSV